MWRSGGETVLLEGAVALALLLEVLEGIGGTAHGVCHFGGC